MYLTVYYDKQDNSILGIRDGENWIKRVPNVYVGYIGHIQVPVKSTKGLLVKELLDRGFVDQIS